MPRITEYDAKDVKIDPSNTGYSAVEMAARRIGPLYEQMAMGTREVGNLTKDLDEETGKAITAFLRFKGLEDQASNINVKVSGSGGSRTLIGNGTNDGVRTPVTYDRLREMHGGPALLSSVARNAISRAATETPDQRAADADARYWQRINDEKINKMNAEDKGNSFGPSGDPAKEMQDIFKEANDPSFTADKIVNGVNQGPPGSPGNQPAYAGPGAAFGPGYQDPYAAPGEDTGSLPSPTTGGVDNSNPATGPGQQNPSTPGLWGDIMSGISGDNTGGF